MEKNLTTGSVFRNVICFSLPYLLSYFLQTLYGMADLFIIGQFEGVASTTAVSVGSQVMHMLTVMLVGLSMGTTVSIGQAQRYEHYDGVFLLLDEADRFDGDAMRLPAAPCVRVRFRGHHLQSPEQYRRLAQYMQANGLEICGFSREITIIDQGLTGDTEKFVTEITIPVQPK